jgi:K+-transporting ATPase ATPase B chain
MLPDVKNVIEFSASTKMSGVDLADGREVRKGAFDVMSDYVRYVPQGFREVIDGIAQRGATPLVVSVDREPIGVIHLKDTVKQAGHARAVTRAKGNGHQNHHGHWR